MIVKEYIKNFEKLGFGMFVHFGLYSILGKGEWIRHSAQIPEEEYDLLLSEFNPDLDWADNLVATAKKAGCKYITLTTRHHDGFSLYDTKGLSDYDAMHAKCKRDLVKEFVDACNKNGIIPFFYHTMLDWHEPSYRLDFKKYLQYLRDSVELICTQYGKIGGIWFDGMWDKPAPEWEEDLLYAVIRKHQPEAMIINNSGLSALGALGHIELDSVTFERGVPKPINLDCSPKYIASEMCEVLNECWGYGAEDICYKAPATIIEELADCRKYRSNFLLNVGPLPNGRLRNIDAATFEIIGQWMDIFGKTIGEPAPTGITVTGNERDFILKSEDGNYYLFCYGLPSESDPNVTRIHNLDYDLKFPFSSEIESVTFMDNGDKIDFEQKDGICTIHTFPYVFGRNLVVRVAKIKPKN
ncbi:MAG: alpha-L-fucosidase [Clostridia bacterium]|nr:alpha-L-fucosidase [Clostridia bacterium]